MGGKNDFNRQETKVFQGTEPALREPGKLQVLPTDHDLISCSPPTFLSRDRVPGPSRSSRMLVLYWLVG